VSGPARRARPAIDQQHAAAVRGHDAWQGIVPALQRAYVRVAEARLLDRLIAGKVWIALVAFALIGIVTLQLGLLELNTSIGRLLEREGSLQRENAALSIENSEIASGDRVEVQAGKLGMELVPAGALRFLAPQRDAVARAASALAAGSSRASGEQAAAARGEAPASAEASGRSEASGGESASSSAAAASGGEAASAQGGEAAAGTTQARGGEAPATRTSEAGTVPAAAPAPSAGPSPAGGASTGAASAEAGAGGGTGTGPSG
jgi:hypothetical protein